MLKGTVAVIGGGIQGVCAALALARLGTDVTLLEAAPALLDRASYRNEGKIHLGFVYANDPSGQTAALMLDAALHFGPLIEHWTGQVDWERLRSRPFVYVTLPGSQLSAAQLQAHYEQIDERYQATYRGSALHYLGRKLETLLETPAVAANTLKKDGWPAVGTVVAATAEAALDRDVFRGWMQAAVAAAPRIDVLLGHRAEAVARTTRGYRVSACRADGTPWHRKFDAVVNCSWTDRLRLDRQLGLAPNRAWVYRLKYRLLGRLPGAFCRPSLTFALGPYGDLVTYADDSIYVSWYPVCMRGWSQDLTPPSSWDLPCRGQTPSVEAAAVTAGVLQEFGAIVPALHDLCIDKVDAGVIFSWGSRDIDHPTSELHRRAEIGVSGSDGYYSINTGKFTCAPLFAHHLTTRLQQEGVLG